jgi:hypothetical protein
VITGEENSNDTWLKFYQYTGLRLKQLGVSMIRLDHTGKDESRGPRGGSAKSADVDMSWRLVKYSDQYLMLECTGTRMQLDTQLLRITRNSNPLHHELTESLGITRAEAVVQKLIDLAHSEGLPQGANRETIRELAGRHGIKISTTLVREVVKRRKAVIEADPIPDLDAEVSDLENGPQNG